jgi:hypothetical protein
MREFLRFIALYFRDPRKREMVIALVGACGSTLLWLGVTYLPWMAPMAGRARIIGVLAMICTLRFAWLVVLPLITRSAAKTPESP